MSACVFNGVNILHFICGVVLLFAVLMTARHVYHGTREEFTVVLLVFSLGFAFSNIFGYFLIKSCSSSQYISWTASYFYYWLYVQSWLIAMKYLHAALVSQAKPSMNPAYVAPIKWAGIIVYSLSILILYLCNDAGFPGYSNTNTYLAWL